MKISNEFDEYPEIKQTDLNRAIKRRNFVSVELPLNVQIDGDIAKFFKTSEAVNHALRSILQALPPMQMTT